MFNRENKVTAMLKLTTCLLILSGLLFGQRSIDTHHMLGVKQPLTGADGRLAGDIAREFTERSAIQSGLTAAD